VEKRSIGRQKKREKNFSVCFRRVCFEDWKWMALGADGTQWCSLVLAVAYLLVRMYVVKLTQDF
jgi:hypothetical protein